MDYMSEFLDDEGDDRCITRVNSLVLEAMTVNSLVNQAHCVTVTWRTPDYTWSA